MRERKKKLAGNNTLFWFLFVLLLCLFCLRFIGLDKDLPAYGVGGYNPTDEGVYSSIGLNLYNYGSINPKVEIKDEITVTPYTAYHIRSNIIENLLVFCGLKLLGDNYYGFRAPIVLMSLINLLLILRITWLLVKKYGREFEQDRWIIIVVELFYTVSFPYLVSSRVVEPTMIRMTFALAAYCLFVSCKDVKWKFFLSGFVITLSLQLVYITNIFLFIPVFVCGCLEGVKNGRRSFWESAFSCIGGCILSLAVGAVYYLIAWQSNFISNALSVFQDFSGVDGYTAATGGIKVFAASILDFFGSNAFLFSLPVLFVFLVFGPGMVSTAIKDKNTDLAFSITAVAGLFLQTLFTNDYIFRKAYLIFPFVLFSLIIIILDSNYQPDFNDSNGSKKKPLQTVFIVLVFLLMLLVLWYRFYTDRVGTAYDYTLAMKLFVIAFSLVGICSLIWAMSKTNNTKRGLLIGISILSVFTLNTYAGFSYVWLYDSFSEKNLMIELNKYSEKPLFGAYSYGFTLYNDIRPVLLTNDENQNVVRTIPEGYHFIDVSTDVGNHIRNYLDTSMFLESRYTGVQHKKMPRKWMLNGKKIDFAIYDIELKSNVKLENSLHNAQKESSVTQNELMKKVAIDRFDIRHKYELLLNDSSTSNRYALLIKENNELDRLYREYNLTDEEVFLLTNDIYAASIPYEYGGTQEPLYGNVYGSINGNVEYPIYGNVYGHIYGNVNAMIYGDVYGSVFGNTNGNIYGEVKKQEVPRAG